MSHAVTVTTGARLHLGLFAPRRESGRQFGGCGLMIEDPGCEIVVAPSDDDHVEAEPSIETALALARDRFRTRSGIEQAVSIKARRSVPRHAGLGSGTQLALAVAAGMARLGRAPLDTATLARLVGRGRRSAVGVHGFEHGGFLVDDGALPDETLGVLASRTAVPAEWRIVLVTPHRLAGCSGQREVEAFETLPHTPEVEVTALRALVERTLVPALRAADFDTFTAAVGEYGRRAGALFSPVQGGVYSHAETERIVDRLRAAGLHGVGQTSWGPTVFAFLRHEAEANDLVATLARDSIAGEATLLVTRPRNVGASIGSRDSASC